VTSGAGYADLVTTATVGLAQRPLTLTSLPPIVAAAIPPPGPDPAVALLDAAAAFDAARRSAVLGPVDARVPAAELVDETPELSPVAAELLEDVRKRGDRELLADLLIEAARAGARIPAPELPGLLDLAARQAPLRAAVVAAMGERGRWLAELNPEWRQLLDGAPADVRPDAWETGRRSERLAWLAERRRTDPRAARETLAAGWSSETGADRAALLAALATGLGPADEPFLEAALDDRKADVREQARALLGRVPDSAFVARAIARAAPVLRAEDGGWRAVPPGPPDAAGRRDGLTAEPPQRFVRPAGWHLSQVIGRTPLEFWARRVSASPAELVAGTTGEFRSEVLAGWRAAALRHRDAGWARALLEAPVDTPLAAPDAQLAALLPVEERVDRAVAVLEGERPGTFADVAVCPAPWPARLTAAVLGYFAGQLRANAPDAPGELPVLAARRIDVADRRVQPEWLRELADHFRVRTASAPAAGRWAAPLERAGSVLELRRRFVRELP
jgi:hypothetical protein